LAGGVEAGKQVFAIPRCKVCMIVSGKEVGAASIGFLQQVMFCKVKKLKKGW
jgi:hypothetical protein